VEQEAAAGRERGPNVLVVLSDQQRPDSCGTFGQALPVTPNLDRLAARGVAFDRAFTVNPVCGPARASIQSGRYPTEIDCWRNDRSLPPTVDTLAGRLGRLGWWTGYVGKWHLASDRGPGRGGRPKAAFGRHPVPPSRRGGYADGWVAADALEHTSGPFGGHLFDADGRRVELHGFRVDAVTDVALAEQARRRREDGDRPWLQFVSYLEPHHQNDRGRTIGPKGWACRFRGFEVPADLAGRFGDWRWNYADYLACCASIDENLGRLLADLDAHRELDDTLVVFASDHGSHFRTRNLEYKRSCHDASIRIPLVVAGPGFSGGARTDRLVTHLDLLPTVLAAAGAAPDPTLPGRALQHAVAGEPWRTEVLVQISESQVGRALRTERFTFAAKARGLGPMAGFRRSAADTYVASHLYDDEVDPAQRHNLVRDPARADLVEALGVRLADEVARMEGHRPRILARR
jgi:uncharacterized sulfatase